MSFSVSTFRSLKLLLAGPVDYQPFRFEPQGSGLVYAQGAGLEGFVFTLKEIIKERGASSLCHQYPFFIIFLQNLFECAEITDEPLLKETTNPRPDDILSLMGQLSDFCADKRRELSLFDQASWIRTANIYQVYTRAFNLQGLREILGRKKEVGTKGVISEFDPDDFPAPFDAVRWTGTYPTGICDDRGFASGSPFSAESFHSVVRECGSEKDIRFKFDELRKKGIRSVFELLPNHTSLNSELLRKDPTLFIHTTKKPRDMRGYFEYYHRPSKTRYWIRKGGYSYDGVRFYWEDTLQLNILSFKTRKAYIGEVKELVTRYGIDAFRVDMAYQLLDDFFEWNWRGEVVSIPPGGAVGEGFLKELIYAVKREFPNIAFIAEGFHRWEQLSDAGFDLIYNKCDIGFPGGFQHIGWYNSLADRIPLKINDAIHRASFLHWQKGGSGMLAYVGHHDLPAPQRIFGDWVYGASLLTLMLPCSYLWYAGTEAGFSDPCPENEKMITFKKPVEINWNNLDSSFGSFVRRVVKIRRQIKDTFGEITIVPVSRELSGWNWVGFVLLSEDGSSGALVIANPSNETADVSINRADLGIRSFKKELPSLGFDAYLISRKSGFLTPLL